MKFSALVVTLLLGLGTIAPVEAAKKTTTATSKRSVKARKAAKVPKSARPKYKQPKYKQGSRKPSTPKYGTPKPRTV